jgi:hypothetical protein
MSVIAANCVEYRDERKLCVAVENGKKYELENRSGFTVRKVKIDKCVQMPEGCGRCDFLFSIDNMDKPAAYFVELKGVNTEDALKQLVETITFLKAEFVLYRLEARVVGRKSVPSGTSNPNYKRLLKQIDPTGGEILIRTNKFCKDII